MNRNGPDARSSIPAFAPLVLAALLITIAGCPQPAREVLMEDGGATEIRSINNRYHDTGTTYHPRVAESRIAFTFAPSPGAMIDNPSFVVNDYCNNNLTRIRLEGQQISTNSGAPDSGAFGSLGADKRRLWVTLNLTASAPTSVEIARPRGASE